MKLTAAVVKHRCAPVLLATAVVKHGCAGVNHASAVVKLTTAVAKLMAARA